MPGNFGPMLHELRTRSGLSLRGLAGRAHVSHSYLWDLERGTKNPSETLAECLDTALDASGRLVALTVQEDDMDRRAFLALGITVPTLGALEGVRQRLDAALGGAVSPSTVDHWEEVCSSHAGAYLTTPAGNMVVQLAPDLEEIADLTAAHPHQPDLARSAAHLAALTGAVCTDLGALHGARHWLHTAQRYSDAAGDRALYGWVVAARAITAVYYGSPVQVLRIADGGIPAIGRTVCPAGPMLHGLRARSLAALGRPDDARTALGEAQAAFDRLNPPEDDDVMFGYPARQQHWLASNVFTRTGDWQAAQEARVEAERLYPTEDMVDRALLAFDYASCLVGANEHAEAAVVGTQTILELPVARRVAVILQRARALNAELGAHQHLAAVREFGEFLAEHAGHA